MNDPTWTDVGAFVVAAVAGVISLLAVIYSFQQSKSAKQAVMEATAQTLLTREALEQARLQTEFAGREVEQAQKQSEYAERQLELAELLRKDQAQPYLTAEIDVSLRESELLVIRVSNAGMTVARDVKVVVDPPLQTHRKGHIDAIELSTLAPGAVWEQAVDTAPQYFEKNLPRLFTVTIEGNGPFGAIEQEIFTIDLDQIAPKLALDSGTVLIAKNLKKIEQHLRSVEQASTWWRHRQIGLDDPDRP